MTNSARKFKRITREKQTKLFVTLICAERNLTRLNSLHTAVDPFRSGSDVDLNIDGRKKKKKIKFMMIPLLPLRSATAM